MAQEVIRYRICDRCWDNDREVEAEVTDRFTLNGHKFAVDLCTDCSAELYTVLMHTWGDLGEKTGEPGVLDKPIRISTGPGSAVIPAPLESEKPALKLVAGRPELPHGAQRWGLTDHARERMIERGFDLYDVLMACERPEVVLDAPSRYKGSGLQERRAGRCIAVVDPRSLSVITVQVDKETKLSQQQKVEA